MFQRFLTPKPKISLSCPKLVAPLPILLITINIYQYPFNFLACFPTSNLIKKLYNGIYFHFSFIFKSIYIHINIYILLSLFNKWCWNSLISTCKKKKFELQSTPRTKYENSFKLDPRYKCKI